MGKTKWYQTTMYLLIALALALFAGMPLVHQAAASPNQATFYSRDSDGEVLAGGTNYSAVHGASLGGVHSDYAWLCVGQIEIPILQFELYRGALFFDTSSLPDDATISSAVLSLYGKSDNSLVDFHITVVDGSVLNEPLVGADYGALRNQTVSGGTFDTAGFSTSGYNDIPLNESGMGWISKTGITKLGLRSPRDIAATEPTTEEVVCVYACEQGEGYQPRLVVTYTTPPLPRVPATNHWGIVAMITLFAGLLVWTVRRRRLAS